MIYLDNTATSFPKPPEVTRAMMSFMTDVGANPGRSGHRLSAEAARIVFEAREATALLLGVSDSRQVVFAPNATHALNLALKGLLEPGDHVVATSMEHNAVMRPLRQLMEERSVEVTVVESDAAGRCDPGAVAKAVTRRTRLVVVNHASNVVGTLAPLARIKDAIKGALLLVDAAQSAGAVDIHAERDGIDLLAFTGHKSMLGPQGTGGLFIRPGLDLRPLVAGGTGSSSESDSQPRILPDRYESGTLNTPGLAGLGAGSRFLLDHGMEKVRAHGRDLFVRFWDGLRRIEGIELYGPDDPDERLPTIALNVRGMDPAEVGRILDRRFGILVRPGLHCAPLAHQTLGTFPSGSVRFGIGFLSTALQIDEALAALREIAKERAR